MWAGRMNSLEVVFDQNTVVSSLKTKTFVWRNELTSNGFSPDSTKTCNVRISLDLPGLTLVYVASITKS